MQQPFIIGITGKAGSGKTAVRELLACSAELQPSVSLSFAGPLKDACRALFVDAARPPQWNGNQKEKLARLRFWSGHLGERFSSARRILQTVGTELFRRHVHEDFWIFVAEAHLAREVDAYAHTEGDLQFALYDDVRFGNEAEWVRSHGMLVHLQCRNHRPGEMSAAARTHASETLMPMAPDDIIAHTDREDPLRPVVVAREIAEEAVRRVAEAT